jgi:hypothetical protein
MTEPMFAIVYAALWALLFLVLLRLGSRSKDLQRTIRQIKRNLHSGWPDPEE